MICNVKIEEKKFTNKEGKVVVYNQLSIVMPNGYAIPVKAVFENNKRQLSEYLRERIKEIEA